MFESPRPQHARRFAHLAVAETRNIIRSDKLVKSAMSQDNEEPRKIHSNKYCALRLKTTRCVIIEDEAEG